MPDALIRRRNALNLLGIIVLVFGIGGAAVLYWTGKSRSPGQAMNRETPTVENGWKDSTLSPDDTKGSSRDLELLYGKVGALVVSFWHRCELFLTSPTSGATVIGLVSAAVAFLCFLMANRAPS
jgi:hypothetical protein